MKRRKMNSIKSSFAITIISLALAVMIACSPQPTPQPVAPDTPIPAPTAEKPPTATPAQPRPTIPPVAERIEQPTPMPEPAGQVVKVPARLLIPDSTATSRPEPTPTQIVMAQVIPTATDTPSVMPTEEPTTVPTVAPTATTKPTPTQAPQDTSPPYVIVVDFYSGNTYDDPGPENCNPERCGGALVQFSEPVLTYGEFIMDIRGKGIMWCYEGCSSEAPSYYMTFSGDAWVEPGDDIVDAMLRGDGIASIRDAAGNEIETYSLGTEVRARVSDFGMVQGPTPVPTPVPASKHNEVPRVTEVRYENDIVELHISEPVTVNAQEISDVQIDIRLPDGEIITAICSEPCSGDEALLTFHTDQLHPADIASSFNLINGATIRDNEGHDIERDFEPITLSQVVTIRQIEAIPIDFSPYGMSHPYWGINVYFTDLIWIDGIDIKLRTASGLEVPCYDCLYGPNSRGDLIEFGWSIDDLSIIPKVPDDDRITEIVVDGYLLSMTGILADTQFVAVPFQH